MRFLTLQSKFIILLIFFIVVGSPLFSFVAVRSLYVDDGDVQDEQSEITVEKYHILDMSTGPNKLIYSLFNDSESRSSVMLMRMAVLSTAAFFGALGALLSVMTSGKYFGMSLGRIVEIEFIGSVFAVMLTFTFAGGFIQGSLFPRGLDSWFSVIYVHQEYAKLIVWSFISGFSERFVPKILKNIAEKVNNDSE